MESVTISIVIPTFNRSKLIQRAMNSLLNQTVLPDEVIVVDDGSTDHTEKLILAYTKENSFIRYIKLDQNAGAQHARNIGIKEAKGNFLLLLDSDNELEADYCISVKKSLAQNPDVDVLTNFSKVVNEWKNQEEAFCWITKGNILKDILTNKTYVDYNSVLIKKEKLLEIGQLDEKCPSFQELDTAIRLSKVCNFDYIPDLLTVYYKHQEERISNQPSKEVSGRYYILQKHKDLWLRETSKEVYLKQLLVNYKSALQHNEKEYVDKIRKNILDLDPIFFAKQKYNKIKTRIRHRLSYYKNVAIKKLL